MSERVALYAATHNLYDDMVVAAKSLLYNNGADKVYFLIEDDKFTQELPDCIHCINVKDQKFFPSSGPNFNSRWTYMVMMRVALTKLFPELDRILHLDVDTLVTKPIDYLWNVDLTGYYYAAVEERQITFRTKPYFNFGVAISNLSMLRDGTDDTIIRTVNAKFLALCEQDAVNSVCRRHILSLPPEYNSMNFNLDPIPEGEECIRHYASMKGPMHLRPQYIFYDEMTWDQIFAHRDEVRK